MPPGKSDWNNLLRDTTVFPAYTDAILGPDPRPETAQEPGLHPLLYPAPEPPGYELLLKNRNDSVAMSPPVEPYSARPGMPWLQALDENQQPNGSGEVFRYAGPVSQIGRMIYTDVPSQASVNPDLTARPRSGAPLGTGEVPPVVLFRSATPSSNGMQPLPPASGRIAPPAAPSTPSSAGPASESSRPSSNRSHLPGRFLVVDEILQDVNFSFINANTRVDLNEQVKDIYRNYKTAVDKESRAKLSGRLWELSCFLLDKREQYVLDQIQFYRRPVGFLPDYLSTKQHHTVYTSGQKMFVRTDFPDGQYFITDFILSLRVYIDDNLSTLREHLTTVLSSNMGKSEQAKMEKDRAKMWLDVFKTAIPVEGEEFINNALGYISLEIVHGGDPRNTRAAIGYDGSNVGNPTLSPEAANLMTGASAHAPFINPLPTFWRAAPGSSVSNCNVPAVLPTPHSNAPSTMSAITPILPSTFSDRIPAAGPVQTGTPPRHDASTFTTGSSCPAPIPTDAGPLRPTAMMNPSRMVMDYLVSNMDAPVPPCNEQPVWSVAAPRPQGNPDRSNHAQKASGRAGSTPFGSSPGQSQQKFEWHSTGRGQGVLTPTKASASPYAAQSSSWRHTDDAQGPPPVPQHYISPTAAATSLRQSTLWRQNDQALGKVQKTDDPSTSIRTQAVTADPLTTNPRRRAPRNDPFIATSPAARRDGNEFIMTPPPKLPSGDQGDVAADGASPAKGKGKSMGYKGNGRGKGKGKAYAD